MNGNVLRDEHFTATNTYYRDEITWCVQKSQRIAVWKKFFRVCNDLKVMALLIATWMFNSFMVYYFQQFDDVFPKWSYVRVLVNGLGCVLGVPINYTPKLVFTRLQYFLTLFGSIVYSITIIAFTQQILTFPLFEHQINSRQEIRYHNFQLAGDELTFHRLMDQDQVLIQFQRVYFKYNFHSCSRNIRIHRTC